ncbi:MAG TPA: papain-like cysteine protease family protein [Bryobacteraceae bacterium]|nr:papain-like cysteine protease family protein [Bryobacteraceae bacterium]
MAAIDFKMQEQQHNNWCWAAVAVSVDHFFDPNSSSCQCKVATRMARHRKLKVKNCGTCNKPAPIPGNCNKPWYLEWALKTLSRLAANPKSGGLEFSRIVELLNSGRPVCIRMQWGKGPDAHFVVISGARTSKSGRHWVDIEDPHSGSSTWLLDEFRTNYQYSQGHWTHTYPV